MVELKLNRRQQITNFLTNLTNEYPLDNQLYQNLKVVLERVPGEVSPEHVLQQLLALPDIISQINELFTLKLISSAYEKFSIPAKTATTKNVIVSPTVKEVLERARELMKADKVTKISVFHLVLAILDVPDSETDHVQNMARKLALLKLRPGS